GDIQVSTCVAEPIHVAFLEARGSEYDSGDVPALDDRARRVHITKHRVTVNESPNLRRIIIEEADRLHLKIGILEDFSNREFSSLAGSIDQYPFAPGTQRVSYEIERSE